MAIQVRGYAKNPRTASEINKDDWLGVQQGSNLSDMKKIRWETLLNDTKDYYTHDQISSSQEWVIHHSLGKYPSVTIIDSAGTIVIGDIEYESKYKITVRFSTNFSGKAFLN